MKVVLVNPNQLDPTLENSLEFRENFLRYVGPSMTFPFLTSKINKFKYDIQLVDFFSLFLLSKNKNTSPDLKILAREKLINADVVGISCMTTTQKFSLEFAKEAKRINPAVKVIVGGPYTFIESERIAELPEIDFVVVGKGYNIFADLLESLRTNSAKVNSILIDKSQSIQDMVPPNYDIYFRNDINKEIKTCSTFISKGCNMSCNFCSRNHSLNEISYRPIPTVIEELSKFADHGIKRIRFDDDNSLQNRSYSLNLFKKISLEKFQFDLSIITRLDTIDGNLVDLYVSAGGKSIIVAIETGSEKLRKKMGKRLSNKAIFDSVKVIRDAGLDIYLYIMVGYPGETDSDLAETEEMINAINPTGVSCNIFHLYPGMPIYKKLAKQFKIPKDYFLKNSTQVNYFSGPELEKRIIFQNEINNKYSFSISGFWSSAWLREEQKRCPVKNSLGIPNC